MTRHRAAEKARRLSQGVQWRDTGIVFPGDGGTWLRPNRISTSFKSAVKRSGLPALSLHGLRHTWATLALVERGLPVTVVSARLGHANVSITLDVYSHAMSHQAESAALDVANVIIPTGFQDVRCWRMLAGARSLTERASSAGQRKVA